MEEPQKSAQASMKTSGILQNSAFVKPVILPDTLELAQKILRILGNSTMPTLDKLTLIQGSLEEIVGENDD